jgi:hypothetical protein
MAAHADTRTLVILGTGYTGRVIYRLPAASRRTICLSSRTPERSLADVPASLQLGFDLTNSTTWATIPDQAEVIVTFPVQPIDQVEAFAKQVGPRIRRLVVLGSSSVYDRAPEIMRGEWVTEQSLLDLTIPRAEGEEYLRRQLGAIGLRVTGIYGPGRNPLNWIRQARVPYSSRIVNLVHVDDLASACLLAIDRGLPGEAYNVSDGTPRRWSDIMDVAAKRWQIPLPPPGSDVKPGKRVQTDKIRNQLGYVVRHPDLFDALEAIEGA